MGSKSLYTWCDLSLVTEFEPNTECCGTTAISPKLKSSFLGVVIGEITPDDRPFSTK